MGFCPLISFRGYLSRPKCREEVFYCRRTYVVWRSFEKIGAQTAEKKCLGKKLDAKYNGRCLLHCGKATIMMGCHCQYIVHSLTDWKPVCIPNPPIYRPILLGKYTSLWVGDISGCGLNRVNRAFADSRGFLIMCLSRCRTWPMWLWSLHYYTINNITYMHWKYSLWARLSVASQ